VVTGLGVLSAFGRGTESLAAAVAAGTPAFAPVSRFDAGKRAVKHAAHLPGAPELAEEVLAAIDAANLDAGLKPENGECDGTAILLAAHADPRTAQAVQAVARGVAERSFTGIECVYTCACVAASTAVANAAARISLGFSERIVVAAGYLVEPDTFAVFDAGRALARDGRARPFSRDRSGLILGDGVAAIVLEADQAAAEREATVLARLEGWARSGDAYHVCRPIPDGSGTARAITAALRRAGLGPVDIGYINANATGSSLNDSAEAAALSTALGRHAESIPVSSTKSVHGHALEASALLELTVTILALRSRSLPVNAGHLGKDADLAAELDLVLEPGRVMRTGYALTVNSAFGGANTALIVGAP
jgi:3-oxoacyl-[acyl-carrier-protein] synthase II